MDLVCSQLRRTLRAPIRHDLGRKVASRSIDPDRSQPAQPEPNLDEAAFYNPHKRGYKMVAVIAFLRVGPALLASVITVAGQGTSAQLRFEDYPAGQVFQGKPVAPNLDTRAARLYRTRIREGVEKGWGVYDDSVTGRGPERPGPNFAGHYIAIRWGCGSPCIQMAVVDAETGTVYSPPITANGSGFVLPLLTLGNRVSRVAEVEFRLGSRLMVVKATPVQSERHPSYEYYFVFEQNRWTLLRRIRLLDDARLNGDP